ncbi:Doublesex- and mab-3-related transcription factor A2 [Holothuria leucospilota]|uniref:Doublesex- and mab-3-related transcription factor A2 n=1 Tax=Holothuria leucospilota TaxID=206669 RepID=A0A9Q1C3Q8_HOLLE|nr:Doublesex- and mab-3-related transcription factor A2 [Holothuria leucospilota]
MEAIMEPSALRHKTVPKCAQCRNHNQIVPRKGHKNRCPWSKCTCRKCTLTFEKRQLSATRQRMRREPLEDDETEQQDEVQLLLNLKSTIEKKEKKKESHDTASEGKQKYRYSGNIQNNMYFPANPQPQETVKPKDSEGVSGSPPVDLVTPSGYNNDLSWPPPCPFCPCNHWEMVLPPTQQMPTFNPEGCQYMPHQLPNAWASPYNHYIEHSFHNPESLVTRFPASSVSQPPESNSMFQYQPFTTAQYSFSNGPLNLQSNNPRFASRDQTN